MNDHRLGKDSPSNKLLFAKDIPQYREMVARCGSLEIMVYFFPPLLLVVSAEISTFSRFYYDIQLMPPVSDHELSQAMQQLSVSQIGHFHTISALKELYIYVSKYNDEVKNLTTSTLSHFCMFEM